MMPTPLQLVRRLRRLGVMDEYLTHSEALEALREARLEAARLRLVRRHLERLTDELLGLTT